MTTTCDLYVGLEIRKMKHFLIYVESNFISEFKYVLRIAWTALRPTAAA